MQTTELEEFGAVWRGSLRQLKKDMDAIKAKLSKLDTAGYHRRPEVTVIDHNNAREVSETLQFAEDKLRGSWITLQAHDSRQPTTRLAERAHIEAGTAAYTASCDLEETRSQFPKLLGMLGDESRLLAAVEQDRSRTARIQNLHVTSFSMTNEAATVEEGRSASQSTNRSNTSPSAQGSGRAEARDYRRRLRNGQPIESLPSFDLDHEGYYPTLKDLEDALLKITKIL